MTVPQPPLEYSDDRATRIAIRVTGAIGLGTIALFAVGVAVIL